MNSSCFSTSPHKPYDPEQFHLHILSTQRNADQQTLRESLDAPNRGCLNMDSSVGIHIKANLTHVASKSHPRAPPLLLSATIQNKLLQTSLSMVRPVHNNSCVLYRLRQAAFPRFTSSVLHSIVSQDRNPQSVDRGVHHILQILCTAAMTHGVMLTSDDTPMLAHWARKQAFIHRWPIRSPRINVLSTPVSV